MYSNTTSLPTPLGGGHHGHVGLIMTPILYATLSNEAYIQHPDDDPGDQQHPSILTMQPQGSRRNAKAGTQRRMTHLWEWSKHEWRTQGTGNWHNQQHVPLYELGNKYTGYLGPIWSSTESHHVLDRYRKITPADIKDCKCRMNAPINAMQPIDVCVKKVDDCVQYACHTPVDRA
jgi:hypothetical protein